ncbi:MAG: hypothetical protein V3S55_09635 [Nitrospiraceae bacterium]
MLFQCLECGYRFPSTAAAELAVCGDDGCPGCGGTDIDEVDAMVHAADVDPDCSRPAGAADGDDYASGSWL